MTVMKKQNTSLDHIVEQACKDASIEVIKTAILFGTTVVIEKKGKTAKANPYNLINSQLFHVGDKG